ncbi:MAG: tRNA dihydrouridine synthase, partial [Bdellovibrio sp.]
GWDAGTRNADEVVKIAYNEGISWVAIHGRTRAQAYNGQADWDYIAEVKSQAKLPIIGNGDILFAQQAVDCLLQSGCDGVMIGRGALKNPYIFRDALALYRGEQPDKTLKRDFGTLFIALKVAIVARCEDRITQIQLKKFAAWFATGYPGAAQFRKQIFQAKTTDEVTDLALNYFNTLNEVSQADTSSEAFLMGGHG